MLKISNSTSSSTILQSINAANEDEFSDGESDGNKTNLSNSSTSKRFIRAGYLTLRGTKKGGGNTKNNGIAARGSDYLNSTAKKAFNYLRHAFT